MPGNSGLATYLSKATFAQNSVLPEGIFGHGLPVSKGLESTCWLSKAWENPSNLATQFEPSSCSPFQPLPLQETVEVDAVEVVGKRGHAQVLMGQPVEKAQPASQPDTPGSQLDGPGPVMCILIPKGNTSANPPANPPRQETHTPML